MEAQSEHVHIACTFFAHFSTDLPAQSVLVSKIYASEFSRKFAKTALLVGMYVLVVLCNQDVEVPLRTFAT